MRDLIERALGRQAAAAGTSRPESDLAVFEHHSGRVVAGELDELTVTTDRVVLAPSAGAWMSVDPEAAVSLGEVR